MYRHQQLFILITSSRYLLLFPSIGFSRQLSEFVITVTV